MSATFSPSRMAEQDNEDHPASRDEILAALRSLEQDGLIEPFLQEDGQIAWRITEFGKKLKADSSGKPPYSEPTDDVIQ